MTTPTMDPVKVLLLRSKSIAENIKWPITMLFAQLFTLIKYVSENIKSTETFVLIVPGDAIKKLLNDPIYMFNQVRLIYVYYDNDDDLKRDKDQIKDELGKLRFLHERNLEVQIEKLNADNAINSSRQNYRETVSDAASSLEQHISAKRRNAGGRHSSKPKQFISTSKNGFSVKNIEQIDSHYVCSSCKLIFRDPYQLECGHRICQSCITNKNDQTPCRTCGNISFYKNIRPDKGFCNELQQLSITCSECAWTETLQHYQHHIDQKHPNRENTTAIVDVYTQQSNHSRLGESVYTTETHQQIMSDIRSSSRSTYMANDNNIINDQCHLFFIYLQEMTRAISNHVNIVSENQERLHTEVRRSQRLLQVVDQNFFSLKASSEDTISRARELKNIEDRLVEQISALKQIVHDASFTSYNGTYIWKITGFKEKLIDARSERQKSIYSPPFYTSPSGYKMCLRLYLNGDSDVRDAHLSLFFVIMRGDFDPILEWPFSYKVIFRLIDQSTRNHHTSDIIRSFLPDIRSNCFQRPQSGMNSGYGFKEFLSIAEFEQKQNLYVKDDTVFIETKIDFFTKQLVLSSISSACETPNDEEHVNTISENFLYMS